MDESQIDHYSNLMVKYLISNTQKNLPHSKADLTRVIDVLNSRPYRDAIINVASQKLKNVFGYKLVEIDTKPEMYILVDETAQPDYTEHTLKKPQEFQERAIETTILAFILMKGKAVTDKELKNFLDGLGIHEGVKHELFGEPKLVLSSLVNRKVLNIVKGANKSLEYTWGPVAYKITTEKEMLSFCSKIYGMDSSDFKIDN